MARTPAVLANGSRITDYLSLGALANWIPRARVQTVLLQVIALGIFMQVSYREVLRCLLAAFQWLAGPGSRIKIAGHSGISPSRSRLGVEPFQLLYRELVGPAAVPGSRGAFGLPGASRGASAYPQLRFVSLLENGTQILFAARPGPCRTGEITLANEVIPAFQPGMLCLADRSFLDYALWKQALKTGAHL